MGGEQSEPARQGTAAMTIADTLRAATVHLAVASDTPRLDAELLMAHALGLTRNDLLLRQRDLTVPSAFAVLLDRRLGGEPVAYITGTARFLDDRPARHVGRPHPPPGQAKR